MTFYSLGGALGTTAGTTAYDRYRWSGACSVAAGFCALALLGWLASHRHERITSASAPVPTMD
ncbi:hypothetical protein AB0J86_05395 [Micromonospora sp. NPDC049559]|uniref:hypothetical protein n=1 Tax=Micromonospora sp. NPDC049559 TaxID=3155923 RepID=UPI00342BCA02